MIKSSLANSNAGFGMTCIFLSNPSANKNPEAQIPLHFGTEIHLPRYHPHCRHLRPLIRVTCVHVLPYFSLSPVRTVCSRVFLPIIPLMMLSVGDIIFLSGSIKESLFPCISLKSYLSQHTFSIMARGFFSSRAQFLYIFHYTTTIYTWKYVNQQFPSYFHITLEFLLQSNYHLNHKNELLFVPSYAS